MSFDRELMRNCKNKPIFTIVFIVQQFNRHYSIIIPPSCILSVRNSTYSFKKYERFSKYIFFLQNLKLLGR